MTPDELFRMGLFSAVQELHMSMSGAGDPIDEDEYYEAILHKLVHWTPAVLKDNPGVVNYDSAVYNLCKAVLAEFIARYGGPPGYRTVNRSDGPPFDAATATGMYDHD